MQPETYRRVRERLAGCQLLRCSEARCHTPARSLVRPFLTQQAVSLPEDHRPQQLFLNIYSSDYPQTRTLWISTTRPLAVRLPHVVEAYGLSPRPWGCAGAVLKNPGPCRWHDGPKIQKSGMWSPETTSIPGISVTGSRRRLRADAPWTTPCTLTRCLSSGPNFRPACLPAQVTWWT